MTTGELIVALGTWAAAVFGLFVVLSRKGTWLHRWTGRGYAASLLVVGVAVLGLQDTRVEMSVAHVGKLLSVALVVAGVFAIRTRSRQELRLMCHAYAMVLSYIALAVGIAAQTAHEIGASDAYVGAGAALIGAIALAFAPVKRIVRRTIGVE